LAFVFAPLRELLFSNQQRLQLRPDRLDLDSSDDVIGKRERQQAPRLLQADAARALITYMTRPASHDHFKEAGL